MQVIEEDLVEQAPQPQVQGFSDEQQPLIENNQRPNLIPEQMPDAQQQQHRQALDGQQPLNFNEQRPQEAPEQEPQIPDEVRQMPDAQQQQILREILRQEFHQFQRPSSGNNTTLLSIFISTIVIIMVAFLLRPQMHFVPLQEFETYKQDNQKGLTLLRENSQKSISEHEAKIVKFGKHWEEILASIMKSNATTKELPNHSIQNLLDATQKAQAEVSKLRKEVSDLQAKNDKLQKSVDNLDSRFRKLESKSEPKQAHALTAVTIFLLISAILF